MSVKKKMTGKEKNSDRKKTISASVLDGVSMETCRDRSGIQITRSGRGIALGREFFITYMTFEAK